MRWSMANSHRLILTDRWQCFVDESTDSLYSAGNLALFFLSSSDQTVASIDLTPEQILDAARQLPEQERKRLVLALERLPTREKARAMARKLRDGYRLPTKQRERLGELLAKGNEGALSAGESAELDALVEAFEKRTHELALAISRGKRLTSP